MNATKGTTPLPDVWSLESELAFERGWDSAAVSLLIRSKSDFSETPACLFLGKLEARCCAAIWPRRSVPTRSPP